MRLYSLARELRVDEKKLLGDCKRLGLQYDSALAALSDEDEQILRMLNDESQPELDED